ncbi:MAG: hypothetical protein AAF502_18360 [Bacteroidota bacterium]
MPNQNILNVILKTLDEVKSNNQQNPNVTTADPSVFDLLKGKLNQIDQNVDNRRIEKGKKPINILDLIRNQIDAAKKQNQNDPNTPTADVSIFDQIKQKLNDHRQNQVSDDVQRIASQYGLDISRVPANIIQQIETDYDRESQKLDQHFAQAIHNMLTRG